MFSDSGCIFKIELISINMGKLEVGFETKREVNNDS